MKNKTAYITQIAIRTDGQSKGIGKWLINLSYSVAKEKGMTTIKLEVSKLNDKAIRFLKRGFFGDAYESSVYLHKLL